MTVKEPTAFNEGLRELQCTRDRAVLESEAIPQTFPISLGVLIGMIAAAGIVIIGAIILILRKRLKSKA